MKMETANDEKAFAAIKHKMEKLTSKPSDFLCKQLEKCDDIRELTRQVYQTAISSDSKGGNFLDFLPELIVENMDEEQIWQELELRNNIIVPQLVERASKLLAMRENKLEIKLKEGDEDGDDDSESNEENVDDLEDEQSDQSSLADVDDDEDGLDDDLNDSLSEEELHASENDERQHKKSKKAKNLRSSVVDDDFFKLNEMNAFLEEEDKKELRKQKGKAAMKDEDHIDYFSNQVGDEDDSHDNPNYKDFFDVEEKVETKTKCKDTKTFNDKDDIDEDQEDELQEEEVEDELENAEEEEEQQSKNVDLKKQTRELERLTDSGDSDDDNDSETDNQKPKSSFELRQERLQNAIREQEERVLGEKPWQLHGEVKAAARPKNSLLEEILEYESTVRAAPVITEETTLRLEDIIRQRIKDQAWDDVVAKVRPQHTPQEYRKQLVLDQEKSKESLAQVYEKEYQREMLKLDPTQKAVDADEEEPKEHKEIITLMKQLFAKLNAFSNFHFTPTPVAPEAKIITNKPAIAMEEVAPTAASSATLLAPEEVYRGPKTELTGSSERTRTDKNRALRKKKQKQRTINKTLLAKEERQRKLGIPLTSKEENTKLLKTITKNRNVEKVTASNDKTALKSSKAFFSKLQDTKTTKSSAAQGKKRESEAKEKSAKKLKL